MGFSKKIKTPTVLQMEALECGAASLSMILLYYHKYVSLEELRIECGVSRDGTKASNLLKAAKKYGLEGKGFKMEVDALRQLKQPAIIFWNFNHFVVFERFTRKGVIINDPACGRRMVELEEFDKAFTGVVLVFAPSADFHADGQKPKIRTRVRKRLKGFSPVLTFLVFLNFLYFIPGLIFPTFTRIFVDEILIKSTNDYLKPLIFAMTLTCILAALLQTVQQKVLTRLQVRLCLSASSGFIKRLFDMPLQFFTQRMPGELCRRLSSCDSTAAFLSGQLISVVINLFSSIFFFVLMLLYDLPLSLITMFFSLAMLMIFNITSGRVKNKSSRIEIEEGRLSSITVSGIEMIESIKASGAEKDFFKHWSAQKARVIQENQKLLKANTVNVVLPKTIFQIQQLLILSLGAVRVMNGDLTIGMLMAFELLLVHFVSPVNSLMKIGTSLLSANADMQRVDDVMEYPAEGIFKEEGGSKDSISSITLKNAVFGYSPLEEPLINGIDIEIPAGKRIAIVGPTGSGKSTIGRLLSGTYKLWSGELLFDGKPLSEIDHKSFAASVAVVNQNITLFEGSIKDNLTMWDDSIPQELYIQAAKDACIHDEITRRPGGYYSKVDEGARNFSGGQRQRLEIARALTANPKIIILDEASSALDPVTEKEIDENIKRRACTTIIIAHRLSTIRDCDEIIVLDHGAIIQRGSHQQLLAQDGMYKELVKTM